jgi:hypothetical protein
MTSITAPERPIHLAIGEQVFRLYYTWSIDRIEAVTGKPDTWQTDKVEVVSLMPTLSVHIAEINQLSGMLEAYATENDLSIELVVYSALKPSVLAFNTYGKATRHLHFTLYTKEGIKAIRTFSRQPLIRIFVQMHLKAKAPAALPGSEFDVSRYAAQGLTRTQPSSAFDTLVVHKGLMGVVSTERFKLD